MSTSRSGWVRALVAGIAIGLPAAAAGFEKSVAADGLTDVTVKTISGAVRVVGWDEPRVRVMWTDDDPEQVPKLEVDAGRLRIGPDTSGGGKGLSADLLVSVPRGLKLGVVTVSGDLDASGLGARVRLVTVSGEVKVRSCTESVSVKTVSGDVEVRGLQGDLEVKTVSGEVAAHGSVSGLVEVKTVSGDIELRGELGKVRANSHSGEITIRCSLNPDGGIKARSFSGELVLALPAAAGFELDAGTRSGSVTVEHRLDAAEISQNHVSGRAGKGGPEIRLSSFSGDVKVGVSR